MASRAHGGVHEEPTPLRREQLDDFAHQDGLVRRLINVVRPTSLFSFPVFRFPFPGFPS
jgi:hypothetical protein